MKRHWRAACIAVALYSLLVSLFVWQALFARAPNDAGILVSLSALPLSAIAQDGSIVREFLVHALGLPETDRFAMAFDALWGWILGSVQYGALAAFVSWLLGRLRGDSGTGPNNSFKPNGLRPSA